MEGRKEMYLMMHSTHFIYGYLVSDMLKDHSNSKRETHCSHSFRLAARDLLYAQSNRYDSRYKDLCYASRGELAGMRNSSVVPP